MSLDARERAKQQTEHLLYLLDRIRESEDEENDELWELARRQRDLMYEASKKALESDC